MDSQSQSSSSSSCSVFVYFINFRLESLSFSNLATASNIGDLGLELSDDSKVMGWLEPAASKSWGRGLFESDFLKALLWKEVLRQLLIKLPLKTAILKWRTVKETYWYCETFWRTEKVLNWSSVVMFFIPECR